jgi:peptide deformylase
MDDIQTYDLVDKSDLILRKKVARFDFANPPADPSEIAYRLAKTMLTHNGLGLAANQCGLPYRVFVIKASPILCCFNPLVVDASTKTEDLDEGCLTFPGLSVKVKRPSMIKVRYTQPNGEVVNQKYIGMTARIFQHEIDHLDGIVFTQRVGETKLRLAINRAKKNGFNYLLGDLK